MRNRIFGAIGVIWGGGILVFGFMKGGPEGNGAYAQGQSFGFIFGAALFVAGLYYLVNGKKKSN
jgi:hypothetical protein